MAMDKVQVSNDVNACVDEVVRRVGKNITLGLPLGLGKPVRFVNALYQLRELGRAQQVPNQHRRPQPTQNTPTKTDGCCWNVQKTG